MMRDISVRSMRVGGMLLIAVGLFFAALAWYFS